MNYECSECKMDMRAGHAGDCSHKQSSDVMRLAELQLQKELARLTDIDGLRNALRTKNEFLDRISSLDDCRWCAKSLYNRKHDSECPWLLARRAGDKTL